jgi:hypothetical protein
MMERLKSAKKENKTAKSNHKEDQVKFLDTMKPKDRDRLKRNEAARELGRIAKYVNGKLESKSVTMCLTEGVKYHTKEGIEGVLNKVNYSKLRQSDDTPFHQEPLLSEFGNKANTPAAEEVLHGTYTPPENTDKYAKILLEALATPPEITNNTGNFTPRRFITPTSNINGWRKAKERTSAGPSGLHFGQFKANAEIPALADLDASIRNFGYAAGFSYSQ